MHILLLKKNSLYAVECQTKISAECVNTGEYCDSEDEAIEWVEEQCWIDSGEGWICTQCNEQILQNLGKIRTDRGY